MGQFMHSETLIIALQFLCGISTYGPLDFFFFFYNVALNKRGIKAVFYLDVSFRGDEVSQAFNGSYQVRAMPLQDLDYRII